MLITKSVQNAVKLAQLDEKWKKNRKPKEKEELTPEMRQLMQYQKDMEEIRKNQQIADIDLKVKSGTELTPDEIRYLKKNHPETYQEYEEIKKEKEAYQNQLKNCKTKEETERVKLSKMGTFMAEANNISQNPNIPKAKKLKLMEKLLKRAVSTEKIHQEFTKSSKYHALLTEEEQKEERSQKEEKTNQREEKETIYTTKSTPKEEENIEAEFEEIKKVIFEFIVSNREVGGSFEYKNLR